MTKENINWRTFDDSGDINDGWNLPMTPAFYVIDHDGVIRHKWVGKPGEKTIDAALEKLIAEAEKANTSF
jgi:peroxiredoxin